MRNLLPMFALGATLVLPATGLAQRHGPVEWRAPRWSDAVEGRLVEVQVEVEGASVPFYLSPRRNDSRRYFQAYAGSNYSVVLRNTTNRRIGVLVAVDGLNVVDGERTKLSSREAMYVLDPYERAEIRGWRTSLDQVRRFVFVDEERSYAERTGQANGDMGWIRVLAFRELEPRHSYRHRDDDRWGPYGWNNGAGKPVPPPGEERAEAQPQNPNDVGASQGTGKAAGKAESSSPSDARVAPPAPRGDVAPRDLDAAPGTGWGDRRYDPVRETRFTPDGGSVDHLVLRYEYASGLLALGIEPQRGWRNDRIRERDDDYGFARPPRR